MKEWLVKMAKELGLAADATEETILAKLSEKLLSGGTAESKLSTVVAQLAAVGVKVEGDKLVKLAAPAPVASNPADAARIAELELDNAKSKLASAKVMVDGIIASGKVPPALKAHLDRIFASTGKLESIQLSKSGDSEVVIKGTVDILEDLRALFNGLPSALGSKLATVGAPKPGEKPAGELGRAVAARAMGKKPAKEPAAK